MACTDLWDVPGCNFGPLTWQYCGYLVLAGMCCLLTWCTPEWWWGILFIRMGFVYV
jgi:hypothetical protein